MSKRNHKKHNMMVKDMPSEATSEGDIAINETAKEAVEASESVAVEAEEYSESVAAEAEEYSESVAAEAEEYSESVAAEAEEKSESTAAEEAISEPTAADTTVEAVDTADGISSEVKSDSIEEMPKTENAEAENTEAKNTEAENTEAESTEAKNTEAENTEVEKPKTDRSKADAEEIKREVRKEAARVAKNKHERELKKANTRSDELDERREARHRRRVRNQVIAYLVIILLVLALLAGGFFAYIKLFKKDTSQQPVENTLPVSEATEQTESIISDMLGMEDDISEPVEEPEVIEEPEEIEVDLLGNYVDGIISSMSLEEKVAGIFIVTPESITGATTATVAGDATKAALEKYAVGGIVYSEKNVSTKDQFSTMIEKTQEMVKYPTFYAIAEEGGTVGPLAKAGYYTAEDTAANIAASGDITAAYSAGINIGFAMREIGLNLNLAPVADLTVVDGNVLGGRSYADTAVETSGFVNEMLRGVEDSDTTACIKYFPGMGMVTMDPAKGRVVSERTDEEFSTGEYLVYQAAIENGAQMIMMSNVIYSAYSEIPATLSEEVVTEILRNRLGFEGVVLSGNLSDMAISQYYGSDEAAIAALKAGCDMLLCPENFETAYKGVLQAVNDGVIDEKRIDRALERILRIKYADNFEE